MAITSGASAHGLDPGADTDPAKGAKTGANEAAVEEPGLEAQAPAIQLGAGLEGSSQMVGGYVAPSFRLSRRFAISLVGAYQSGSTTEVQGPAWTSTTNDRWRANLEGRFYLLHTTAVDPWLSLGVGAAWIHRDQISQGTSSFTQPFATQSTSGTGALLLAAGVGVDIYMLPWLSLDAAIHLQTEPPLDAASSAYFEPIVLADLGLGFHLPLHR